MTLTADAPCVDPIAPTPFLDDGRIDTVSIDRPGEFDLAVGATGFAVLDRLARRDPRARPASA